MKLYIVFTALVLFILVILTYYINYTCFEYIDEFYPTDVQTPKVALYSCNFGNYRNELQNGIDHFFCDSTYDMYFFTDAKDLKSTRWNVVQYKKPKGNEFIDENRLANKQVKFLTPEILKDYDILIYIDSKYVKSNKVGWPKSGPLPFFETIVIKLKDHFVLHEKHDARKTVHEEMAELFRRKTLENNTELYRYFHKTKNIQVNIPLVELGFIVRRNTPLVNALFRETYNELVKNRLRRDQIVYPIVVSKTNFPVHKMKFVL